MTRYLTYVGDIMCWRIGGFYGVHGKDMWYIIFWRLGGPYIRSVDKHGLTFSERQGIETPLRVGGKYVTWVNPMKRWKK